MDGIVNINKPMGITSHDVVYKLRKILNIKKIGHTGTLDPDATGVLPMCVGRGTKLAEYLTSSEKQYLAKMTLGAVTDTQDKSGEILKTYEVNVTKEEIEEAVSSFIGDIMQIPPMYSAIKINGKKLYELAREGQTVEREPRPVTIYDIKIININPELNEIEMLVDCSKGTYIRTLCNDIGEKLGCGGYMSALKRTRSGRFSIENSYMLEEIEIMAEKNDFSFMTPIEDALSEYEKVTLAEKNARRLCNGMPVSVEGLLTGEIYRVFDEKGNFLALVKQENNKFSVMKTFFGGV